MVPAVGILCISQEAPLEPLNEFALKKPHSLAPTSQTGDGHRSVMVWKGAGDEPPGQDSHAASPR